jgi:thiamine-phosphate diphosphorylase
VNDRVDIALAAEADGVHVGVGDLPVETARDLAGAKLVIGYSPETDEQGISAADWGADYLGVGPVYGTSTKPDAGEAIGLVTLGRRAHHAGIPVVGIGGIDGSNAAAVIEAGAEGVAVVSAILKSDDPRHAAAALAAVVSEARASR